MFDLKSLSFIANILGFVLGLPTIAATYYQALKARQEARQARDGTLHSLNCLEFITGDGNCINLVPLDALHSMPKPGDVVFLPGDGVDTGNSLRAGAYLVESVEHIYTRAVYKGSRPLEARLTKTVAQVTSLNPDLMVTA